MKFVLKYSIYPLSTALLLTLAFSACSPEPQDEASTSETSLAERIKGMIENSGDSTYSDFIQVSIEESPLTFSIPALQSPVAAQYQGKWVLFGGRKYGLHSMDNDPPAFQNFQANDTIWVVDLANQQSVGVPVPFQYANYLSASSQQYFQDGETLYVNGGFTYGDSSTKVSNWTSDALFEINLPNLIQYVLSEGAGPNLDQIYTKFIRDPYLQVTGGEMLVNNGNFYIIGGQNYIGSYLPGNTGEYTNSIRKFNLVEINNSWGISDTLSVVDPINLHRRDFNLAELINTGEDSLGAAIYGGVFTKNGLGYPNSVYISGLGEGNPQIDVDTETELNVNYYSSAKINSVIAAGVYRINRVGILGGITYKRLSSDSSSLEVPPITLSLPFSNMISSIYTGGSGESLELVQMPPNFVLPTYLGANAVFFPLPSLLYGDSNSILDLDLVFPGSPNGPVLVGYMYGGIQSPVANTFTADGAYNTKVNSILYGVYMNLAY